jgi:alanyl-tRNA synthetase
VRPSDLNFGELIIGPAKLLGGGSGGKPDFAQAGGPNIDRLKEAMTLAMNKIKERLK